MVISCFYSLKDVLQPLARSFEAGGLVGPIVSMRFAFAPFLIEPLRVTDLLFDFVTEQLNSFAFRLESAPIAAAFARLFRLVRIFGRP